MGHWVPFHVKEVLSTWFFELIQFEMYNKNNDDDDDNEIKVKLWHSRASYLSLFECKKYAPVSNLLKMMYTD